MVLAAIAGAAGAQEGVVLPADTARIQLTRYLEQLEDRERRWTLADVAAEPLAGSFRAVPDGWLAEAPPDAGLWTRFRVERTVPAEWLLRVHFYTLEKVCVYWPRAAGVTETCTGSAEDFATRPVEYHGFAFPVPMDLLDGELVHVYAESSFAVRLPMDLITREQHYRQVRYNQLRYGAYYGFMLAMVLYNLMLYVSIRDTSYLLYSLHIGCFSLAFFGFEGLAAEYLWPSAPWLRTSPFFLLGLAFVFGGLYVRQFLLTREHAVRCDRLLLAVAALGGAGALATFVEPLLAAHADSAAAMLFTVAVVIAAVVRLRAGYRPAWFLLGAMTVFLAAVPVATAAELRWIPWSRLGVEVVRIGVALGALLLAFGLAYRVRELAAERERLIPELEARSAELESFTYTVSHDLKSPLITIKGFLGLLKKDVVAGNAEAVERDVQRIEGAATRMSQLLDELLELSRIGRIGNAPERVELDSLVLDALDLVAGRLAERKVDIEVAPGLPVVWGDRSRMLEVLQNLIDNAVKYLGDQESPRIEIGIRAGKETVIFVSDNGVGIDPAYHEKVFGLFERLDAEEEGTGIGLALVKRIVELHGGRIWVESEGKGQGSTFCFTLGEYAGPE